MSSVIKYPVYYVPEYVGFLYVDVAGLYTGFSPWKIKKNY